MGSRERQEREREAVRQAILGAARELFTSEGYRNVSMRKIAERIGYSPAAIYSYFDSKDAIFFSLAEEGFRRLAERVGAVLAGIDDPFEALRRALWGFYLFGRENPEYFELMFLDRSVPSLSQGTGRFELFQHVTARGEAAIRSLVERGMFTPDVDPAAALHILWAAMLGPASLALTARMGPRDNTDALARDVLESVLAGFRAGATTTFDAPECPMRAATHTGDVRPAAQQDAGTRHSGRGA